MAIYDYKNVKINTHQIRCTISYYLYNNNKPSLQHNNIFYLYMLDAIGTIGIRYKFQ